MQLFSSRVFVRTLNQLAVPTSGANPLTAWEQLKEHEAFLTALNTARCFRMCLVSH
jgi:hypothetical protein